MSQLELLTGSGAAPPRWYCATCHGAGDALRLLYPDERDPGGPFVAVRRCPTCRGERTVDYDPYDRSGIPF